MLIPVTAAAQIATLDAENSATTSECRLLCGAAALRQKGISHEFILLLSDDITMSRGQTIYTVRGDSAQLVPVIAPGEYPSWTPDGRIIYISAAHGSAQIWLADADGRNARQISRLPSGMNPIIPLQAKTGRILFEEQNTGSIWIMNGNGSGLTQLVRTHAQAPFIAPSGSWFTYTLQTDAPYHREVWRMNTDGTDNRQLTFTGDPRHPDANASAISPDEKTIAIFSGKEALDGAAGLTQSLFTLGHRDIAIISADGGPRHYLTHCTPVTTPSQLEALSRADCIVADDPAWTPDGKWIIYTAVLGGLNIETWLVNLSGENAQQFYPQPRGIERIPLIGPGQ